MTRQALKATLEIIVDDINAAQESQDHQKASAFLAQIQGDSNAEDRHKLEGFRLGLVENRLRERLDSLQLA